MHQNKQLISHQKSCEKIPLIKVSSFLSHDFWWLKISVLVHASIIAAAKGACPGQSDIHKITIIIGITGTYTL